MAVVSFLVPIAALLGVVECNLEPSGSVCDKVETYHRILINVLLDVITVKMELSVIFGGWVGKYCTYVRFLKEAIKEQSGEAAASTVSWSSQDVIIDSLIHDFNIIFSGIDILWVAQAVCAAW